MKATLFLFFILSLASLCKGQNDDWLEDVSNYTDNVADPILEYEKYNAFIGGEDIRKCGKSACNGLIKDYHPNGALKHKAFYQNGQLLNGYENYFDNEQLERKFEVINSSRAELHVYYKDGTIRSNVEYNKKLPIKWMDYYPNGNLEFVEEYDKKMEYYIKYNFYYIDGKPQNILELVDEKERIYVSKEYYRNGQVKEEGMRQMNASMGDYNRIGVWKFYDQSGTLTSTKNYVKGEEVEEEDSE